MFRAPTASACWRRRRCFTRRRCLLWNAGRTVLDAALLHATDHFPASALWLRREGYFLSYGAIALRGPMIGAYQALARPALAAVVSRRMGMGHVR
jgi:hypothetical protein